MKALRITAMALVAVAAQANAQLAFDNAADAVYTGGNINGLNGGYGFGPWVAVPGVNTSNAGNFQFTSAQNGNGSSGNIDSAGRSWGTYANSTFLCSLTRPINVSMTGARTITVDWDNGWIDQGGYAFVAIGNYSFGFNGGQNTYWYDLGSGQADTGLPFTTDGIHLKLILNGTGGYHFSATPNNSTSVWAAANFSGASIPTNIAVLTNNTGFGSSNDAYLNNLKIVPEPASLSVLGLGLAALLRRRRR